MKNNKLLGLLTGLLCISLCLALMLTACRIEKDDPEDQNPTVGEELSDPTQGKPSADEPTQPEQTQPEQTQPEVTEPEATQPEETQPEETQPSGGSSTPSVNTGTGGGYDPGASQPTEPEDATEPEIVVPEPGSEKNAYAEYIAESGSFTTVKIPAGQGMYYRLKTPGSFLRVEDSDAAVIVGETTYEAVDGVVKIALPADGSQAVSLVFVNQNAEDKAFGVEVLGALGAQSNPIEIDSIADIQAALEEGDSDGIFYRWNADQSGILKLASDTAEVVVTVNGETAKLSESDGSIQLPVSEGDEVVIQVLAYANEDGTYPAIQAQVSGYVAVIVELTVSQVPAQIESVTVLANQSVIYRITGIRSKVFKIQDADYQVAFDGQLYSADADGVIAVSIPAGTGITELELFNNGAEAKPVMMEFGYPLGHILNPHSLTALGDLELAIPAEQYGYYYTYTAPTSGIVTFQIWTAPEAEEAKTDIVITNATSGESAGLWNGDVQNDTVSVVVTAGDELTIRVTVVDSANKSMDASLAIYGELYGSEELPINVAYPGFTAHVPVGETLYYEGYNIGGLILSMNGENVTISHNGESYTPDGSQVSFGVVTEGRSPARFAITNTGSALASYEVVFTYPVGHAENPAALALGENSLTQAAGASDYYHAFTAPRAGTVTVAFDSSAQWVYAVDNVTQGIYGDTQWSDSDPMQPQTTVSVKAGDKIVLRVNTYDTANMFENPAGTVTFAVSYISGPTTVSNVQNGTTLTLMKGEGGLITGDFYGYTLVIDNARNAMVEYDGVLYMPNQTGSIMVEFPKTGTDALECIVYNGAASQLNYAVRFATGELGTAANPETLTMGSHSVSFSSGDDAYYFKYVAEARGTLVFTFETDVDGWYLINNNILRYTTTPGQNTYRLAVREGMVVSLSVCTFDPTDYRGVPEGTIDFTVEFK